MNIYRRWKRRSQQRRDFHRWLIVDGLGEEALNNITQDEVEDYVRYRRWAEPDVFRRYIREQATTNGTI